MMMIELEEEITQHGEYLELEPNRESWDKNFKDFRNFVEIQAKRGIFDRYPAILVLYLIYKDSLILSVVPPGARQNMDLLDIKLDLPKKTLTLYRK